ncbi:MAG TPA: ABC transporter ATP-binding protein [Candidatus Acidoferrum sp.]|nr:ABC transporter ATP-binding protein [Candidatus Acidoferrum sp.]
MTSATPSPDVLLAVERLEVAYHRVVTAVQGVSLIVPRGKVVALLGTNGAGKTTTLRAISGFLGIDDARVTEGRILYKGQRIENRAPHHVTGLGIVLVPERSKVFENLSVDENLEATVPGHVPGFDRRRMAEAVFEYFPALARVRAREAGLLSGGERQMLAIGAALMCGPELLLVDELSLGLAPVVVEELMTRLQTIRRTLGMTILLVEQNAQVALDAADHAYVMENGRIVLDGPPERLLAHQDVREFYLGAAGTARRSYRDVKQYRRSRRWYG